MDLKRCGVLFLGLLLIIGAMAFVCAIDPDVILKLSAETNAHGEIYSGTAYPIEIKYSDIFGSPYTGTDLGKLMLLLSSNTNAHAQIPPSCTGIAKECVDYNSYDGSTPITDEGACGTEMTNGQLGCFVYKSGNSAWCQGTSKKCEELVYSTCGNQEGCTWYSPGTSYGIPVGYGDLQCRYVANGNCDETNGEKCVVTLSAETNAHLAKCGITGSYPNKICCVSPSAGGGSDCGNNVIEGTEQCDGTNLNGKTCITQGFTSGDLSCTDSCLFDTSGCTGKAPYCGDEVKDAGEECDGNNLNEKTCIDKGFTGGTLSCSSGCTFDTDACTGPKSLPCGNGIIEGDEECDGTALGGNTCLNLGLSGGGTLSCNDVCKFDTKNCISGVDVTKPCSTYIKRDACWLPSPEKNCTWTPAVNINTGDLILTQAQGGHCCEDGQIYDAILGCNPTDTTFCTIPLINPPNQYSTLYSSNGPINLAKTDYCVQVSKGVNTGLWADIITY